MKKSIFLALILALGFFAQQASAQIYGSIYRTLPYTNSNTGSVLVPLNNGNTTNYFVFSSTTKRVIIAYNAECSVGGAAESIWLDIDIMVGGVAVQPTTGLDTALCSSEDGTGLGSWAGNIYHVVATLQPGFNLIQVASRLLNGPAGTQYRLDDTQLTVWD